MNLQNWIALLDLTSLNDDDTPARIEALCADARRHGVAAVCVYPSFVAQAVQALQGSPIAVATVLNFPRGDGDFNAVLQAAREALAAGARELDWVMPRTEAPATIAAQCAQLAELCHGQSALLKVILETGALSAEAIAAIAPQLLQAGADFLKTSTGKIEQGASLEATAILLQAIQAHGRGGLKVSGGVRRPEEARAYGQQAKALLGADFLQPARFRIGASSLLQALLNE